MSGRGDSLPPCERSSWGGGPRAKRVVEGLPAPEAPPPGFAWSPSPSASRTGRTGSAITLIDLGYGNLGSIRIAFERLGMAVATSSDPAVLAEADRLILPGVGAAAFAMERLRTLELAETIRDFERPFLGICLGMQLLFDRSEEGDTECLGLIPGTVRKLAAAPGRPVPHMGWSRLTVTDRKRGLADGDYVYFAHSYACEPGRYAVATALYGEPIAAAVARGTVLGCQFHPERSGEAGARFLKAFLSL